MFTNQAQTRDWGDSDDSWQDGWDVLIPWEKALAERIREHEQLLASQGSGFGGGPSYGGQGTSLGSGTSAGAATATPTATTAVSTGGA